MCCFFLGVPSVPPLYTLSPSLQFGQVHATLRKRVLGVLLSCDTDTAVAGAGTICACMLLVICGVAICTTCHLFGSLASCCRACVVPAGIPENPMAGVAVAIPTPDGVAGSPIGCGYCPGEII